MRTHTLLYTQIRISKYDTKQLKLDLRQGSEHIKMCPKSKYFTKLTQSTGNSMTG
jgi:hypothetical protein